MNKYKIIKFIGQSDGYNIYEAKKTEEEYDCEISQEKIEINLQTSKYQKAFICKTNSIKIIKDTNYTQYLLYNNFEQLNGKSIGIMIAGNAGSPGGYLKETNGPNLRDKENIKNSWGIRSAQEENLVSLWLKTQYEKNKNVNLDQLFRENISQPGGEPKWGMKKTPNTIQGYDYTEKSIEKYNFAYSFGPTDLYVLKKNNNSEKKLMDNINFIFVFGPNIRIYDGTRVQGYEDTEDDYNKFFRPAVKNAIKAGLDEMQKKKINIPIVARISGGVFSDGKTQLQINNDYYNIVNEILSEGKYSFEFVYLNDGKSSEKGTPFSN